MSKIKQREQTIRCDFENILLKSFKKNSRQQKNVCHLFSNDDIVCRTVFKSIDCSNESARDYFLPKERLEYCVEHKFNLPVFEPLVQAFPS